MEKSVCYLYGGNISGEVHWQYILSNDDDDMGEVAIAVLMTYQIYSSERHQSTKSPSFDFLEPLKYKYCLDRFTKKSIDHLI